MKQLGVQGVLFPPPGWNVTRSQKSCLINVKIFFSFILSSVVHISSFSDTHYYFYKVLLFKNDIQIFF